MPACQVPGLKRGHVGRLAGAADRAVNQRARQAEDCVITPAGNDNRCPAGGRHHGHPTAGYLRHVEWEHGSGLPLTAAMGSPLRCARFFGKFGVHQGPALHEGLARLKALRTDIVLIDPQFAPKVIAKAEAEAMVTQIASIAKEQNIDLFHRFAVMWHWHEVEQLPFETFVSPDGLHMNDWSYACLAKWLATSMEDAATRPTTTAAHLLH